MRKGKAARFLPKKQLSYLLETNKGENDFYEFVHNWKLVSKERV